MRYSQEFLEEMAAKVDLLDYASRTVDFTKHSGSTHFAICPFHKEDTASLAVNTDTNIFHCFGCLKSGNIYQWIQWTEGLSFEQAVQKVAALTNSEIHEYTESESVAVFKELRRLNTPKNSDTPDRTILDFKKDYADKYLDELPEEWIREGIQAEEIKKYEIRIDPSSNRIVYPVYDQKFNLIGVKGRTRFKNYKELRIPKYINYYKISTVDYLTGMKQAQEYVRNTNNIIIVEGIKSVMKLDGWGYHNAVSAETSTLNEYQVQLLIKLGVRDVTIAFDKDVSMQKIISNIKLLRRYTNVFVVYDKWKLLEEKDSPTDKGREIWESLYERLVRI